MKVLGRATSLQNYSQLSLGSSLQKLEWHTMEIKIAVSTLTTLNLQRAVLLKIIWTKTWKEIIIKELHYKSEDEYEKTRQCFVIN